MTTRGSLNIKWVGDEDLLKTLQNLDFKLQHKTLKKIVANTAQKIVVRQLRADTPKRNTGNLKRSIGKISGKSKRSAVYFVGPRMSHRGGGVQRSGGSRYSGWLANIIEHNKGGVRKTKKGATRGIMPNTYKGWIARSYAKSLPIAGPYLTTSIRTIMEREMKRYAKRTAL